MLAIHRILAPIDFSALSLRALARADELAQACEATLHVCYVHVPLELSMMDGLIQESPGHLTQSMARAQEELEVAVKNLKTPPSRRSVEAILGHPVEAIVE